ncbi:MAG: winged helix-turn-helix transcriptional regulator [Byssovorax sp.]
MRKESSTNLRNERWLLAQCPFSLTLAALGSRWGAAILWKILRGETRFGDLARALPLITQKMLAEQLERLQALGIIEKRTSTTRPIHVEYAATERGRSLEPVLTGMRAWGEGQQSSAGEEGDLPEIKLLDRRSGPLPSPAARPSRKSA